jgi:hypothetical protein
MLSKTRGSPVGSAAAGVIPERGSDATPTGAETPSAKLDAREIYTCPQCEHVLRVVGLGRHRVYFEPTDQLLDDPVMDRVCPSCGLGLPGKNAG